MNIFGKRKKKPSSGARTPQQTADVITGLRKKLGQIEKREEFVQKKIDAQMAEARQRSKRKDKRGALMCLKRKKLYEKEIAKYQGARLTLEQQIITLESATVNVETFNAMRTGATAMEQIHGELSSEKVEEVMDEISDQMAVADEISDAISNPIGGAMEDDDDLLAELDELDEDELADDIMGEVSIPGMGEAAAAPAPAVSTPVLPSAPTGPVASTPAPAAAEDPDMAELEALAAGMA